MIRDVVANPDLALAHQNMLKDDLAGVLRVKVGRRHRIFYLASSEKRRAIVLMFGFRKEGDKNDAYEVVRRLVRKGAFDAHFAALGVKKPV